MFFEIEEWRTDKNWAHYKTDSKILLVYNYQKKNHFQEDLNN